eukprot:gene22152-30388_t
MQNEDVAKLVMSSSPFKDFLNIGKKLCTEAIILGSTDNVTALIVDLKQRITPSAFENKTKSKAAASSSTHKMI